MIDPSILLPIQLPSPGLLRLSEMAEPPDWVVLKFGGTSVATAKNWGVICNRVLDLLAPHGNNRVWVTISALSQTTNLLLKAVNEAVNGDNHLEHYENVRRRHMHLAVTAGLTAMQPSDAGDASEEEAAVAATPALQPLMKLLAELKRILEGVSMVKDASPRIRARICSFGTFID